MQYNCQYAHFAVINITVVLQKSTETAEGKSVLFFSELITIASEADNCYNADCLVLLVLYSCLPEGAQFRGRKGLCIAIYHAVHYIQLILVLKVNTVHFYSCSSIQSVQVGFVPRGR